MKHKHTIFVFLLGWLFSVFFSPNSVLRMVKPGAK